LIVDAGTRTLSRTVRCTARASEHTGNDILNDRNNNLNLLLTAGAIIKCVVYLSASTGLSTNFIYYKRISSYPFIINVAPERANRRLGWGTPSAIRRAHGHASIGSRLSRQADARSSAPTAAGASGTTRLDSDCYNSETFSLSRKNFVHSSCSREQFRRTDGCRSDSSFASRSERYRSALSDCSS
jgi:hypothetical protein